MTDRKTDEARHETGYEMHYPVSRAIDFLALHYQKKPAPEMLAEYAGLSCRFFEERFREQTGVPVKDLLGEVYSGRKLSCRSSRKNVRNCQSVEGQGMEEMPGGIFRSNMSRLRVKAEVCNHPSRRGAGLTIRYAFLHSPFGRILAGMTADGICWTGFCGNGDDSPVISMMMADWPAAVFIHDPCHVIPPVFQAFSFVTGKEFSGRIHLFVRGTRFRLKVWDALLSLPYGRTASYADIACRAEAPRAFRAVGAAAGSNFISLFIPCHRIILSSGKVHGYRWGAGRKTVLLAMERIRRSSSCVCSYTL